MGQRVVLERLAGHLADHLRRLLSLSLHLVGAPVGLRLGNLQNLRYLGHQIPEVNSDERHWAANLMLLGQTDLRSSDR